MLQPNIPQPRKPELPPGLPTEKLDLAKWPPDDDDMPADPPGGGGGGGIPAGGGYGDDGNFKKGAIKPISIIVGLVLVIGLGVFLFLGMKGSEQKLEVKDAAEERRRIMVLPKDEQITEWRKWAKADTDSVFLKQEALKQLAFAKDPEGVQIAIEALKDPRPAMKGQAARALAWYGKPLAEPARQVLIETMKETGVGFKPQVAWALVVLGEASIFDEVMGLYKQGHLSQVKNLNDGVAFDPEKLVAMVPIDKLAEYHKDESPAVRQLVATALSKKADPKHTDILIKLLEDKEGEVSREAAPGLGKIGDDKARTPLVRAIKGADKDSRKKYLHALRDGIGTAGLVLALDSVADGDDSNKDVWYKKKQVFDLIRELSDPRGGDALFGYLSTKPHIHWQLQAAMALAEIGDARAVPTLAKRMRMRAKKIYEGDHDYLMLLQRDGHQERVEAARMIADLAKLNPDKHEEMRVQAEDGLIFYAHDQKAPHANTLRALAYMGSTKDIKALRDWAFPDEALPLEGQQGQFPLEWTIAQSALRYLGAYKEKGDWTEMLKQLERRDGEMDISQDALMGAGRSMLAMSLAAIMKGSADGLSEWGDEKAAEKLFEHAIDEKNHESSRTKACMALAWTAKPEFFEKIYEKFDEFKGPAKQDQIRLACLLDTLIQNPQKAAIPKLIPLMSAVDGIQARHQVARAIGFAGVDKAQADKLLGLMKDDKLRLDAALALILGSDSGTAARAIAMFDGRDSTELEELSNIWYNSFHVYSQRELDSGRLFRWIDNAVAIERVQLYYRGQKPQPAAGGKEGAPPPPGAPQQWARALLTRDFDLLIKDRGPHSYSRVVLRKKLYDLAKGSDAAKRAGAMRALLFMKEQGTLLALKEEKGETGKLAAAAYHELMNPKVVIGVKEMEKERK